MIKICYSIYGEALFEYDDSSGWTEDSSLRKCVNDYLGDYGFSFDENDRYHIALDLANARQTLAGFIGGGYDLSGSNFSGTDLYWSFFCDANLENANFSRCDLRGASLNGANLRNVNFEYANLGHANIGCGADLSGADLTGAIFKRTVLVGAVYDSKTIFPDGFEAPPWMVQQLDNESDDDFHKRIYGYKERLWGSFSQDQQRRIIHCGIPYDSEIHERFAKIVHS